jgi:hypothetical protein
MGNDDSKRTNGDKDGSPVFILLKRREIFLKIT